MVSYLNTASIHVQSVSIIHLPFVGIVDALEGDILLILKQPIEFRSDAVEAQFGQDKCDIGSDEWGIAYGDRQRSS